MTLATHMVVGAAAASVFTNHPVEAFVVGWASHYVMDAIVHWDYPLSITGGTEQVPLNIKQAPIKLIAFDVGKVLLDVAIGGLILGLLAWRLHLNFDNIWILFAGAIGGTIPDFLQFLYGVFKVKILALLQRFHGFMHAKRGLREKPIYGIFLQLFIIAVASFFVVVKL